MSITETIIFVFTHLSLLSFIFLFYITLRGSQRSHTKTAFCLMLSIAFVWNMGTLLDIYYRLIYDTTNMFFITLCYFGICFVPITVLLLGRAVARLYVAFKPAHALLLVVPCVSMAVICTNSYHNLFFINFSVYSHEAVYGTYYYLHSVYSYGCILVGVIYMTSFSIKRSGVFTKQLLFILLGMLIPLTVNVLYSFNLLDLTFSINASMFTFGLLCFAIAFYKYDFLRVSTVATQNVIDLISDGYLAIDTQHNIVDFNKAMIRFLPEDNILRQNIHLGSLITEYCAPGTYADFLKLHAQSVNKGCTVSIEYTSLKNRFFSVEITPIFKNNILIGTIILLRDLTQIKHTLETIKETQAIMIEKERLAFLGQLIGGIAHNLKTPIFSISGGMEGLIDLIKEYEDSVGDASITADDHHEIIKEMYEWVYKIKIQCTYISDMISAVKGQAIQLSQSDIDAFTIDELLKRVNILMKNELISSGCELRTQSNIDIFSQISGDVNNLVQVFDNLIVNAIFAYEGKPGFIDLSVTGDDEKFVFTITDYGKGIEDSVQVRLFKEMVTTKGKHGTGLGLYLSHSTIRGHFHGQLSVTSETDRGSTFTITIPRRAIPDANGQ